MYYSTSLIQCCMHTILFLDPTGLLGLYAIITKITANPKQLTSNGVEDVDFPIVFVSITSTL